MDLTKAQEKEVEKRVQSRLYSRASKFKNEFKKQMLFAISAAFGFLIALSWREPISDIVNIIVGSFGDGGQVLWKFISAIVVTFLAVLGLMIVSKWSAEKK